MNQFKLDVKILKDFVGVCGLCIHREVPTDANCKACLAVRSEISPAMIQAAVKALRTWGVR